MILVTGSAGLIGKHLMGQLLQTDQHVVTCDPRGGDITTDGSLFNFLADDIASKLEVVFHLGAISDTTCEDGRALLEINVQLPLRLADFCKERAIPLIYASSASVYGNEGKPLNGYAQSKNIFDKMIELDSPSNPWYGLRFFNVYGLGEEHKGKQASMVHQLIEQQKVGGPLKLFAGSGQWSRDFVHVDDVVSVLLHMWKQRPQSGIYDVGTGESRSFFDLAHAVMKGVGENAGVEYKPFPESLVGKYQFHTQADLTNLRAAGYTKPFLSLEEGIARMNAV